MSRARYLKWTPDMEQRLIRAVKRGGYTQALREFLPDFPEMTLNTLKTKGRKLDIEVPMLERQERYYARLAPLSPADDRPSAYDEPRVVRKGVGQWKADAPAVRWVFDLGIA